MECERSEPKKEQNVHFSTLRVAWLILAVSMAAMFAVSARGADTQYYTTEFDGAENPLSEGGVWSHTGLDWAKVAKSNGIAYGTQTGTGGYDDAYAILSGFLPNQSGSAQVHLSSSIDRSCTHEVEILLRWSDSAHTARGYEANINFGGSAQIVRWNGAIGDFTVLGGASYAGFKHGDTFAASINGNIIAMYVNGNKIAQLTDNTYSTGNPGIGFFRRECGTGSDLGFLNYTATGGDGTTVPPTAPANVRVN
jgi:hypothetical protein